jgi:glycosyltransferase involved in cell wall biosynthesis
VLAKVSNLLKRFPTLWRIMVRIYGAQPFNPAKAKYQKKFGVDFNHKAEMQELSVIFDAQCLQTPTRKRGIGRYSISLIAAVCAEQPEKKFGVLLTTLTNRHDFEEALNELEVLNCPNLHVIIFDPFDNCEIVSFLQAQKDLESFLLSFKPAVIISLSSFEKLSCTIPISYSNSYKRLGVLYDLIRLQYKNDLLVSNYQVTGYQWALTNLHTSDSILSISHESEAGWRSLVAKDSKIRVVYGAGYRKGTLKHSALSVMRSGILCVGAEQRHKNIANLIKAYSLLDPSLRASHELTILGIHAIGARAKLKRFAKSLNISIKLPGYVNNVELEQLYSSNKLLVMPSLAEGLSMPILEAWEMGLPAVGSAGTVAEELIVDSDLLFDPNDVSSIAATIQNMLNNEFAWQQAAKTASEKVSHYSWKKTAKLVLEVVSEETKSD